MSNSLGTFTEFFTLQPDSKPKQELNFETLEEVERRHILAVVKGTPTRVDAARYLGINRKTLYRKLKKYGIS